MKFHYFLIAFGLCGSAWAAQTEQSVPAASTEATTTATTPSETDLKQATAMEAESGAATQNQSETQPATTGAETAPQQTAEQDAPMTEQAGFSRGSVVRSVFTTAIQEREPVDKLQDTAGKADNIFYFSELRDMSGQTATHRWEHEGKVVSEVKFNVRGPRWRVWSSKAYTPGWEGEWKVSVLNGAGEIISEDIVKYTPPVAEAAPATTETPTADSMTTDTPADQNFEPPVNPEMIQ